MLRGHPEVFKIDRNDQKLVLSIKIVNGLIKTVV
jgi:hypothetical protein